MFTDTDSIARGVPLLLIVGFLSMLVLLLAGRRLVTALAGLSDRAFTCVSGHLRPPPDPWLETSLRQAFAELDRDLAAILRNEQAPRQAQP